MSAPTAPPQAVRSLIPARLDRLPWTRFHWMVVVGLGVSWILDGLEIQLVANVGSVLTEPESGSASRPRRSVSSPRPTWSARSSGALVFGRLTDRLGRRRLFILTLVIYLVGSGLGGLSWNLGPFLGVPVHRGPRHRRRVHRDQLGHRRADPGALPRPGRHRGQRDVLGRRPIGSLGALVLLNPDLVPDLLGLAHLLLHRPGARPGHHLHPASHPREPPLAADARVRRGGRGDDRRHRGDGPRAGRRAAAGRREQGHRGRPGEVDRDPARRQGSCSPSTAAARSSAAR